MNYIEEVAKVLDIKLYEEFYIQMYDKSFGDNTAVRYRLTYFDFEYLGTVHKDWQPVCSSALADIIFGKYKIKKAILTVKEKKYLSDFIDPFKSRVMSIQKHHFKDFKNNEKEFISLGIKENDRHWREMELPQFDAGKYYKGLETGKAYTLEELGL